MSKQLIGIRNTKLFLVLKPITDSKVECFENKKAY